MTILDLIRRWSNLALSIGQIAVTIACFAFGTSFDEAAGPPSADPPIVPAGYAFTIWSVIYAGCLGYGIYQFLPLRAGDPLLRRIGFFTASGFLGCCCWLLSVRLNHLAWTIPCIFWMAASLFGAFAPLWKLGATGWPARLLIIAPISIYSGWLSVAIFANTAALVKARGWEPALLGQSSGSILLIVAAAALAAYVLHQSRGNLWYGGTILWALAAIGVRNQFQLRNLSVAVTAWLLLAVFALLAFSRPVLMTRMVRR